MPHSIISPEELAMRRKLGEELRSDEAEDRARRDILGRLDVIESKLEAVEKQLKELDGKTIDYLKKIAKTYPKGF